MINSKERAIRSIARDVLEFVQEQCAQEQWNLGNASLALQTASATWATALMKAIVQDGKPIPAEVFEAIVRDYRLALLANLHETLPDLMPIALKREYNREIALHDLQTRNIPCPKTR